MKERILSYRNRIDDLLAQENDKETDWNEVLSEHLIQVSFFQHERLIHLIVTVCFALMTVIAAVAAAVSGYVPLILLVLMLLVLLVPYIMHYYLLENEVQKMYRQYDAILVRIHNTK
jgi:hypothetical protein